MKRLGGVTGIPAVPSVRGKDDQDGHRLKGEGPAWHHPGVSRQIKEASQAKAVFNCSHSLDLTFARNQLRPREFKSARID
jgi:hypothetical protein